jgi:thiol-disulfide isomerase/thioredoxin
MKKYVIASVLLPTLFLIGCSQGQKPSSASERLMEQVQKMSRVPFPTDSVVNGVYTNYEEGVIGNGEISVLFFHAAWCPQCKRKEEWLNMLYKNKSVGVSTYKIDFDTADELKQSYAIQMQDTFVVIGGDGSAISTENSLSAPALAHTLSRASDMNNEQMAAGMMQDGGMMQEDPAMEHDGSAQLPPDTENQAEDQQMEESVEEGGMESAPAAQAPQELPMGQYVAYEDGVIGNGSPAVLFFAASWCPSCQANDARLSEWYNNGGLYLSVHKIDYDNSADLKARYGVVQQDTFVRIDAEGNAVRLTSFPNESALWDLLVDTI